MNYQKLSKEVSYTLRHAPWEYELEIGEQGWVSVRQLIESLSKQTIWINVSFVEINQNKAIFKLQCRLKFRKPTLL